MDGGEWCLYGRGVMLGRRAVWGVERSYRDGVGVGGMECVDGADEGCEGVTVSRWQKSMFM